MCSNFTGTACKFQCSAQIHIFHWTILLSCTHVVTLQCVFPFNLFLFLFVSVQFMYSKILLLWVIVMTLLLALQNLLGRRPRWMDGSTIHVTLPPTATVLYFFDGDCGFSLKLSSFYFLETIICDCFWRHWQTILLMGVSGQNTLIWVIFQGYDKDLLVKLYLCMQYLCKHIASKSHISQQIWRLPFHFSIPN